MSIVRSVSEDDASTPFHFTNLPVDVQGEAFLGMSCATKHNFCSASQKTRKFCHSRDDEDTRYNNAWNECYLPFFTKAFPFHIVFGLAHPNVYFHEINEDVDNKVIWNIQSDLDHSTLKKLLDVRNALYAKTSWSVDTYGLGMNYHTSFATVYVTQQTVGPPEFTVKPENVRLKGGHMACDVQLLLTLLRLFKESIDVKKQALHEYKNDANVSIKDFQLRDNQDNVLCNFGTTDDSCISIMLHDEKDGFLGYSLYDLSVEQYVGGIRRIKGDRSYETDHLKVFSVGLPDRASRFYSQRFWDRIIQLQKYLAVLSFMI